MPLPSGVVQTGPRTFVLNPGGHVLHHCDNLAQIAALRGAALFFSDGSYVIVGGRDLDAALAGLTNASTIGQLGVDAVYQLSPTSQTFFCDTRGHQRMFLSGSRVGVARTLTHVFGVEVGPLTMGLRIQNNNVAADQGPGALNSRYGLESVVGVTAQITTGTLPGYTNPGAASTNAGGQGYTLGMSAGTGAVITVPLGVRWETLLAQMASQFDNADKDEAAEKLLDSINALLPALKKISPVPCLHVPLRYVNSQWRLVLPQVQSSQGGAGVMTGLLTGAAGTASTGMPFTVLPGGYSANAPTLPIASISGRPIQHWIRGAHVGEQVIGGHITVAGTDFSIQQLLQYYHDSLTVPSSDNIPARNVVNGIPVTNAVYATQLQAAAANPANLQAINLSIGNSWDQNGFSPFHALVLLSMMMNASEYSAIDLVALSTPVFWPLVTPTWKPATPPGWSSARFNNYGFSGAPSLNSWLATMAALP